MSIDTDTRVPLQIPVAPGVAEALEGDLVLPPQAVGIVLFAHGSGSSRHSPRNRFVADRLNRSGIATLLLDLLTPGEERIDQQTGHLRFDIGLLAGRLVRATDFLRDYMERMEIRRLPTGYFGASTGAAAALVAAAGGDRRYRIRAIVSRGGRPDLAGDALPHVTAATLLIVGGDDDPVIPLNQMALQRLGSAEKRLEIVPGATHLFEEPGALERVADLAADWFRAHLTAEGRPACEQAHV